MSGQYARGSSSKGECATLPCSTWQSISNLRGCDIVAIKVEDVAPHGYSADRATVRQRKTGRPVRFELAEQTRQAIDDYIRAANKKSGEHLFVDLGIEVDDALAIAEQIDV
jgi:hypothetical protein